MTLRVIQATILSCIWLLSCSRFSASKESMSDKHNQDDTVAGQQRNSDEEVHDNLLYQHTRSRSAGLWNVNWTLALLTHKRSKNFKRKCSRCYFVPRIQSRTEPIYGWRSCLMKSQSTQKKSHWVSECILQKLYSIAELNLHRQLFIIPCIPFAFCFAVRFPADVCAIALNNKYAIVWKFIDYEGRQQRLLWNWNSMAL